MLTRAATATRFSARQFSTPASSNSQRIGQAILRKPAVKPMMDLHNGLAKIATLTPIQAELIKIRASQVNGCAHCLDLHARDALKAGEKPARLAVISAWRDTNGFFTEEEQAILALTEEVTKISDNHVADATYERAIKVLGEDKFAETLLHIIEINAWNRIAITSGFMPKPEKE